MDFKKLDEYRPFLYLLPFAAMLCACLNFIVFLGGVLPFLDFAPFVVFHLLFLFSLSAVCGNLAIEIFLYLFEDSVGSSLHGTLYCGHRFLPLRPAFFVAAFIAGYVVMTRFLPYISSLKLFMFAVPSLAILFNAPHFRSGRVRYVCGAYYAGCRGRLARVISYYIDGRGALFFVTDDGKTLAAGAAEDADLKAVESEFAKNGLPSGSAGL